MALGVGVLRPEGGAEGIDIAEGHGEVLAVELAGDGQVGLLAEEVLGVVHGAVGVLGHILQVQGGHLEHLTGALAVAGGDDGRVDVDEALVLEEAVDGVGRGGAHPEGGGEQVRPGPQVLDGPQELHAVALLLEGIVRGGGALHFDGAGFELQGLLGLRGQYHGAGDDQRRAHVLGGDILIIFQGVGVHDHLEIAEAGAVVELDEAERLHVPDGTDPAAHGEGLSGKGLAVGVNRRDFRVAHLKFTRFLVFAGQ